MGYYKDRKNTVQAIDSNGFLHSGDEGCFDEDGTLWITGRIKELIITAGGENVAPVLIENQIKSRMGFISQCFLVGEQRKFLVALLTLKVDINPDLSPSQSLTQECKHML